MCIGESVSFENVFLREFILLKNVLHRKMCFIGEFVFLETVVALENVFHWRILFLKNVFL